MHRIDGAGATSDNRFTDGDPASATAATLVTDDWLNAVQEEIVSVITDASITPAIALDKTKSNQLVTAIKRIISASAIAYSQATETVLGVMKVATQPQVNAGTDDATAVTPKKLRAGFSASIGINGYLTFPTWLSGLIIQWGTGTTGASGAPAVQNFPITFPNNLFVVIPKFQTQVSATADVAEVHSTSLIGVGVAGVSSGSGGLNSVAYKYIALGN